MAGPIRRALPDNLDPLVDTLANVVGILVIVIVLIQIELGDALERVTQAVAPPTAPPEAATRPSRLDASVEDAARIAALRARTDVDLGDATALAASALAALAKVPLDPQQQTLSRDREVELRAEAARLAAEVAGARQELTARRAYADALTQVPAELVARLPDPEIRRGREAWVLVRYGRVYPVDRQALLDAGSRAIEKILRDAEGRSLRPDEFESAAHYLRKRVVGQGNFRWQLRTEPEVRVQLAWRSPKGGIDRAHLAGDARLREWLARLDPERDFLRFHVWNDSFETYLAARQVVETAGFRAGWQGHDRDSELDLGLRFGAPRPRERAIEVD